ncbi:MAG: VWA domain-containing protein, partial [Leptospiraceae bacterium]|nr:VWA domain-containing protein [Leptospiraceae bacterium]
DIRIEARDDEAIGNYTLMHNFEKVETIEEFQGNWRDIDGGDELEEHADALRQTRLSRVLRSDDPTHSVFKADIPGLGTSAEARDEHLPGAFIAYDEWDQRSRSYRSNFCRVYLSAQRNAIPDYYHRTLQKHRGELRRLRKHFYKSVQKPVRIGRQLDGVDPDIDALVERQADLMAGHSVNDRVYIQINKKHHDLALLCLLDISLSTDGFADNRRILDIEKQSLILFGELLNEAGVHFQIDGFASRTRNHCYYHNIKSFELPWNRGAALLSGVEPRGYTRMGTAIRHAHSLLRRRPERQRWIILLSDGKPNDYDRYEGGYGLADVRQAIREAEREQVRLYCLSVDPRARHHLPHMIGRSR